MDTLSFFETILPTNGVKYLVLFLADSNSKKHIAYTDLAAMAAAAERFDQDPRVAAVYHACGGFQQTHIDGDDGRRRYRTLENWGTAKAFWMDIDCGPDKAAKGAGYTDKRTAAKAVFAFSQQIGWAKPLLVDSGRGLHAYWPLTKPLKHAAWCTIATRLKAAAAHLGMLADPTRTADFASILRPVGSTNRKHADVPKLVHRKSEGKPQDAQAMTRSLFAVVSAQQIKYSEPAARRVTAPVSDLNDDLTAHLPQYPQVDVSGDVCANHCVQLAAVRDTQGDASYEHWRGVIGVLTHCVDGLELAEAWSAERANTGHDSTDWRTRYETWSAGPSTCEFFAKVNPGGCDGCKHRGKVTSPIQLGKVIPISVAQQVEVAVSEGVVMEVTTPALPKSYGWDGHVLTRTVLNKDEVLDIIPFSRHLFYPTTRIRGDDGVYRIGIRMHLHNNRIRDFEMAFEAMSSAADMLRALAKYELMQTNNKDAAMHMTAYLRDSLEVLKKQVEETNTLVTFGWKDDLKGFLIGDRYYHRDGTVRTVRLGGYAAHKAPAFGTPKGTLQGYADPINHIYNRPGMECMQYALCSGWGSIFNVFCEELYCGLMTALVGGDSGKGKSTAAYASLYAFGDANAMAMKSDEAGTRNAIWATVGAFNNIPMVFDELTKIDPDWLSTFTYTMSLGEEKSRLQSTNSGVKMAPQGTWRMSPFVTANKDLHGALAASQANSQAEAVRLIQIHVDRYDIPLLEETVVQQALGQMRLHRGVAGDALIRYAVTHTKELFERINAKVSQLVPDVPGTKFRFYRNHAACTLVACEVANELGIASFDAKTLQAFSVNLMQELAQSIAVTNTVTSDDAFNSLVNHLMSRILVTNEYRDSRHASGVEMPNQRIIGEIAGRFVQGTHHHKEFAQRLFLSQRAIREWCTANRTDYNNIIGHLRDAGALLSSDEKITLTKGTNLPRIQHRCVVIDMSKLEAAPLRVIAEENEREAA